MNAQKQAVKTVQNADFKKDTERSPFLDEIGTRAGKGAVRDADRALSGNVREKTIFQVEKNHFS